MNKEFLKKCWEDKRWHSLMVLIIWILVLALMILSVFILNAFTRNDAKIDDITDTEKVSLSYFEKLDKLLNSNYDFTYIVYKDDLKIKFEGANESNIIEGYKENTSGIVKYRIKDQKIYQLLIDEEIEMNNLYDDIDASLVDLNYIVEMLKQFSENDIVITEEGNINIYSYDIQHNEQNIKIVVNENKDEIEKIVIEKNNEKYELMYKVK